MDKRFEGWVKFSNSEEYRYFPEKTSGRQRYTASITDEDIVVYANAESFDGVLVQFNDYFDDVRNPTIEELTLFELDFGVDLSCPLSQLF